MRAIIVSHSAIKAANRDRYRALARAGVDVTLVIPTTWKTAFGVKTPDPEPRETGVSLIEAARVGKSHSNLYCLALSLGDVVRGARRHPSEPTAIFIDEDPAGVAAVQGARAAASTGTGLVVLAIQNLYKTYPLPFELMQRYVFAHTRAGVSISRLATEVLNRRGFQGEMIPMPFTTALEPLDPVSRQSVREKHGLTGPLVGYVGRLVVEKGIDVLLHAIELMPGVRLAIVGDGPERANLEALTKSLGVADRVRYLGAMSPEDAVATLGALDVLALPSLTRKNWAEQFGRVLIEAMALGVPVVASDSGSIAEVVGDAGILVSENDPNALAGALLKALEPEYGANIARLGIERVSARYRTAVEGEALLRAMTIAAGG